MSTLDIVASTAEAAFATDERGTIVAWNAAAEALLGHPAARVCGRPCYEVLGGMDVFGNQYCCESCPLTRMAHRHKTLHCFELDVRTASGVRARTRIRFLVAEEPPSELYLIHLLEPVDKTEAPVARDPPPEAPAGVARGRAVCRDLLTAREVEVLRLLAEGTSTRGIAGRLFISVITVRNHIQSILGKLEAHSRLEAVALARRHKLL